MVYVPFISRNMDLGVDVLMGNIIFTKCIIICLRLVLILVITISGNGRIVFACHSKSPFDN
jgi:hypothetical protein